MISTPQLPGHINRVIWGVDGIVYEVRYWSDGCSSIEELTANELTGMEDGVEPSFIYSKRSENEEGK